MTLSRTASATEGTQDARLRPPARSVNSALASPRLVSVVNEQPSVIDLDVHAPPFERNPSSWGQRLPIVGLALLACAISVYLALYQWGLIDSVWDPFFGDGSEKVLDSTRLTVVMVADPKLVKPQLAGLPLGEVQVRQPPAREAQGTKPAAAR